MSFQQSGFGGAQLKQTVAYNKSFQLLTSAGVAVTGATVTVSISKNASAFATITGGTAAVTEIANGWYSAALVAGDTNVQGDLAYNISSTGGSGTSVPLAFTDQVRSQIVSDIAIDTTTGFAKVASNVKINSITTLLFPMTLQGSNAAAIGLAATMSASRSLGTSGFAPCVNTNGIVEVGFGVYGIVLPPADTNSNVIAFRAFGAGLNDNVIIIFTQP